MSALAPRRAGTPGAAWIVVLLLICVVFGVAAGVDPKYAAAAGLGVAFVVAVFADLVLGVAMFTALSFLDVLTIGGAVVSFDKIAGLLLLVSWGARRATSRRTQLSAFTAANPGLTVALVAFAAWTALSVVWAFNGSDALTIGYRQVLDILLIPIVYTAVQRRRDVKVIIYGYLIGAAFSALYGLVNPSSATSKAAGRLVGALGEANQSATVLVAALALCGGLYLLSRRSPAGRILIILTTVLAIIGLLDTLSRAGLLALAFVLLAATVIGGRWRRRAATVFAIALALAAGYYLVLAPSQALQRVTSSNSSGRNDIWLVAWRAFSAHPAVGVGAGNFQDVSAQYLQRPGLVVSANDFLVDPKVVHNIYLGQLAELGIPGLLTLLAVLAIGIRTSMRAARVFERRGDPALELLARGCALALLAFLAADFFASELLSKQLWIVFALGPALAKLARLEAPDPAT